jgi:hypothetical protein
MVAGSRGRNGTGFSLKNIREARLRVDLVRPRTNRDPAGGEVW